MAGTAVLVSSPMGKNPNGQLCCSNLIPSLHASSIPLLPVDRQALWFIPGDHYNILLKLHSFKHKGEDKTYAIGRLFWKLVGKAKDDLLTRSQNSSVALLHG